MIFKIDCNSLVVNFMFSSSFQTEGDDFENLGQVGEDEEDECQQKKEFNIREPKKRQCTTLVLPRCTQSEKTKNNFKALDLDKEAAGGSDEKYTFKKFEQEFMADCQAENPGLKRQQLNEKLWKMWERSQLNPKNQKDQHFSLFGKICTVVLLQLRGKNNFVGKTNLHRDEKIQNQLGVKL